MSTVFVDTWAWLALALRRDEHHDRAKRQHAAFLAEDRVYVTTDYVLSEVITYLYQKVDAQKAEAFPSAVFSAISAGTYQLERISALHFDNAWQLRRQYSDKPAISFTDFTSFVVMQKLNIYDVFTGDMHFAQVNKWFRMFPVNA